MKIFFWALLAASLAIAADAALQDSAAANSLPVDAADKVIVARGKGFEISRHQMDQVLANARVHDAQLTGRTNASEELPPDDGR